MRRNRSCGTRANSWSRTVFEGKEGFSPDPKRSKEIQRDPKDKGLVEVGSELWVIGLSLNAAVVGDHGLWITVNLLQQAKPYQKTSFGALVDCSWSASSFSPSKIKNMLRYSASKSAPSARASTRFSRINSKVGIPCAENTSQRPRQSMERI